RPNPAARELRGFRVAHREAAPSAVALLVGFGPGHRRSQLRHVLRQGMGADVERHGPRQLGDRPELLVQGAQRLPTDAGVRVRTLSAYVTLRRMTTRVLILGAGFGGLELATRLSDELADEVAVTLVDKHDSFVFGFSKLDVMFAKRRPDEVRAFYRDIAKP